MLVSEQEAAPQQETAEIKKLAMVQRQDTLQALSFDRGFVPANMAQAIEVAKMIAYSGMVPKQFAENPGAVLVAMQMGAEVGLSPMAAVQNIAVINGRPSLWGDAALAVCMRHPMWGGIKEDGNEKAATCAVWRKPNKEPLVRTFTIEDARVAGLLNKDGPWKQYPKRMLQMRARSFALRDTFPDALRGLAIAEEAQDIVQVSNYEPAPLTAGTHKFGFAKPTDAKEAATQNSNTDGTESWADAGPPPVVEPEIVEKKQRRTREPGEEGRS